MGTKLSADILHDINEIVGDIDGEIPEGAITARDLSEERGLTRTGKGLTRTGAAYRLDKLVAAGRWAKGRKLNRIWYWPLPAKGKK